MTYMLFLNIGTNEVYSSLFLCIYDAKKHVVYLYLMIPKIKSNLAIAKGCSLFKILYESKGSGFSIKYAGNVRRNETKSANHKPP